MTAAPRRQTRYELTLVGELGPVLRAMAERSATTSSEVQSTTILRVHARDDEDLVDVVLRLRCPGLEVTSINTIPGRE